MTLAQLCGLVFLYVQCKGYEKHTFNKPLILARHKAQPEALKLYWLHPQRPQGTVCLRDLRQRFLICLGVLVLQLLYDKQLSPSGSSDGRYLPGKSMTKSSARRITGHTWGWILSCSWASWSSGLKIKIEAASPLKLDCEGMQASSPHLQTGCMLPPLHKHCLFFWKAQLQKYQPWVKDADDADLPSVWITWAL